MRGRTWLFEPLVWFGAAVGAAATAFALFAGRYVPFIDWAAHLGLISVLANGGETGALQFFVRSWAPSPYLLFYAETAVLAQLVPVDVAAKLVLVETAALLTLSAAALAGATGRSPRLGLIGPLALFGISLGWGFGSFVVATPFLIFALSGYERFLAEPSRRRAAILGVELGLLFLAHGFLFAMGVALLGLRAVGCALLAWLRRAPLRARLAPLLGLTAGMVPALGLAAPTAIALLRRPTVEAGTEQATSVFELTPVQGHLASFAGDALHRGSEAQVNVMLATAALLGAWLLWSMVRPLRGPAPGPPGRQGLDLYAAVMAAFYLFGPMSVNWPSSIWLVYPRFAVIAALLVMLLPRCDLSGRIGTALAIAPLALIAWNSALNAALIRQFSGWAAPYDEVRATIPPGARVLALTAPAPDDPPIEHHAIGSLYDYLMVDGASYVAFLFDKPELPVHQRPDVKLRAPFWRTPGAYDPATDGVDYEYLVLRGRGLVARTREVGLHDEVRSVGPWVIFKTKAPRAVAELRVPSS